MHELEQRLEIVPVGGAVEALGPLTYQSPERSGPLAEEAVDL